MVGVTCGVPGVSRVVLVGVALLAVACSNNGPAGPSGGSQTTIGMTFASPLVVGGTSPVAVTLTVSPAPASDLTVALSSSNTSAASVPPSVMVTAGMTVATFSVTTSQVQLPVAVKITATSGSVSKTEDFGVEQIPTCGPFLSSPVVMPFFVYADANDVRNHWIPSGWFGDIADLQVEMADRTSPQMGTTAARIDYTPRGPQGFAGIFFQCPEGNFGTVNPAGFDLSLARQIRGWIRAAKPGQVELKAGGLGAGAAFGDSLSSTSTNPVVMPVGTGWNEFVIDVSSGNRSHMISGLMIVTSIVQNPTGNSFFLDQISWQ